MVNTYVLLRKRVDELRKDLVGDDGFSKFVRVVGKSAEGKSGGLLDGGNVIQKKRSEESHYTGTLKSFNVLGALGELSNGLDEGNSSLLVSFKGGQYCTGHSECEICFIFE